MCLLLFSRFLDADLDSCWADYSIDWQSNYLLLPVKIATEEKTIGEWSKQINTNYREKNIQENKFFLVLIVLKSHILTM